VAYGYVQPQVHVDPATTRTAVHGTSGSIRLVRDSLRFQPGQTIHDFIRNAGETMASAPSQDRRHHICRPLQSPWLPVSASMRQGHRCFRLCRVTVPGHPLYRPVPTACQFPAVVLSLPVKGQQAFFLNVGKSDCRFSSVRSIAKPGNRACRCISTAGAGCVISGCARFSRLSGVGSCCSRISTRSFTSMDLVTWTPSRQRHASLQSHAQSGRPSEGRVQ